jgi:hypothetical protein
MSDVNIYGLLFTVLFNVAPLFQMYKIVINKDSENNSYGLWFCGMVGQVSVLCYNCKVGMTGIFSYINSVIGFGLFCLCIYL